MENIVKQIQLVALVIILVSTVIDYNIFWARECYFKL